VEGMPYMSTLFVANLGSLASHRDDISRRDHITPVNSLKPLPNPLPAFTTFSHHKKTTLSPQGSELKKNSQEFLHAPTDTVHLSNMA